jgi:Meiotically up-regulated gene 113
LNGFRYLHTFRDRHGKVRHYVRRPGSEQIAIEGRLGTKAFLRAYHAAIGSRHVIPSSTKHRFDPDSIVYFARGGDFIKIGVTKRTRERLTSLQTASPTRLEIILALPGGEEQEKHLHRKFATDRERGEWFRASPKLMAVIEAERTKLVHNWLTSISPSG